MVIYLRVFLPGQSQAEQKDQFLKVFQTNTLYHDFNSFKKYRAALTKSHENCTESGRLLNYAWGRILQNSMSELCLEVVDNSEFLSLEL